MALIPIRIGDGVEGADDCTIVITRPIVETEKPAATRMMEDAEALAAALEKYLPAMTLTRLEQILTRKSGEPVGRRLYDSSKTMGLREVSASADRGYDTLSCGHVVTRFFVEDGKGVPLLLTGPPPRAWCLECGLWKDLDPQQFAEMKREIEEAMP